MGSAYIVLVFERKDKGPLSMPAFMTKDYVQAGRETAASPF